MISPSRPARVDDSYRFCSTCGAGLTMGGATRTAAVWIAHMSLDGALP